MRRTGGGGRKRGDAARAHANARSAQLLPRTWRSHHLPLRAQTISEKKGQSAAWGRLHAWRVVGARVGARGGAWDFGGGRRGKFPALPCLNRRRRRGSTRAAQQASAAACSACVPLAAPGRSGGRARGGKGLGAGWPPPRRHLQVLRAERALASSQLIRLQGVDCRRRCRHNLQSRAGRGRSARARRRPGAPPDA